MKEPYEQILASVRDRTAFVFVDLQAPRDAPSKQFIATRFEPGHGERMRPQGQGSSLAVTPEQARELLAAGAEWNGPEHLRAEVIPNS